MPKALDPRRHLNLSHPQYGKARALRSLRLLATVLAVMAVMFFFFPLVFEPRVDPPVQARGNNPLSLTLRISNQNPFTPLTEVEYSCKMSRLRLAAGEARSGQTVIRGQVKKFESRTAITVPCEAFYSGSEPVQAAEFQFTMAYRVYPWPWHRTSQYLIRAQIDNNGQLVGWNMDH